MALTDLGFVKNRTSGKATAGIHAVYFLAHQKGVEPLMTDTFKAPGSKDWFPVLSLRGSVSAAQEDPSIEEIKVDQFDAPIGITTEPGNFTFEAQLPSLTKADLSYLFGDKLSEIVDADEDPVDFDGLELLGLDLDGEIREMSVLLQTKTNGIIVFSNAQMTFTFQKDNETFMVKASGRVLAPQNENNKMVYLALEAKKA